MTETRETALRRMKMRSMRRGIKEMDLILQQFSDTQLGDLTDADLALYDQMLGENDHDLYAWITRSADTQAPYEALIAKIRAAYSVA